MRGSRLPRSSETQQPVRPQRTQQVSATAVPLVRIEEVGAVLDHGALRPEPAGRRGETGLTQVGTGQPLRRELPPSERCVSNPRHQLAVTTVMVVIVLASPAWSKSVGARGYSSVRHTLGTKRSEERLQYRVGCPCSFRARCVPWRQARGRRRDQARGGMGDARLREVLGDVRPVSGPYEVGRGTDRQRQKPTASELVRAVGFCCLAGQRDS